MTTRGTHAPASHQPADHRRGRARGRRAGTARPLALVAVAGVVALGAGACSAQSGNGSTSTAAPIVNVGDLAAGVTVSGTGEVTGTPDTLLLTFGVSLLRPSVDRAVADNAVVSTKVQDALRAGGIPDDRIQTQNYAVSPNFRYEQGQQVPDGYRVDNTVTAKVKDLEAAGGLIDAVVAAGGDDVRVAGVSFTIEDDAALLTQAREKAFDDAKGKAEQYASLSGRTLGAPEAVSEVQSGGAAQFRSVAEAYDTAAGAPATTPINPGQLKTTLQVTVRYPLS